MGSHMNVAADIEKEWVSIPETGRILGISDVAVRRIIETGALTVRRLPGCHPRVFRDDVVRLLEASTIPAKSPL